MEGRTKCVAVGNGAERRLSQRSFKRPRNGGDAKELAVELAKRQTGRAKKAPVQIKKATQIKTTLNIVKIQ